MNNINVFDIIFAAAWSYWVVLLINICKVKERIKRLFNKKDNNELPIDYDYVHSQLDNQVKRIASKYDIELTFIIDEALIHSKCNECFVQLCGKNYNHQFSFSFFERVKHPHKKTHVTNLKYLILHISLNLEDKLVNFLILDKLISLEKKQSIKPNFAA